MELDQVAQQIHADTSLQDVPVVCLTSLTSTGNIGSVGFFGGFTFVANPFLLQDMVNCIAEMLEEKRRFGCI